MKRSYILVIVILVLVAVFCMSSCDKTTAKASFEISYDKESDFGLFFYGDNHDMNNVDMIRSTSSMSNSYLDKSKPTIIWVHGWEPSFADCDYELTLSSDAKKQGYEQYSFVKKLKEKGYNVATFQYQTKDKKSFIAKDLATIMYNTLVETGESNPSMAYLMASELCLNMGEDYSKEIIYVGHSCGSFVSLSINYYIDYFINNNVVKNKNLLASRIALADPYFNSMGKEKAIGQIEYLTNKTIEGPKHNYFGNMIVSLAQKGVAFDAYLGMTSMASGSFNNCSKEVLDNCVVVDMDGLRARYGDTSIHVLTRDWVFMSIINNSFADGENNTNSIKSLKGKMYKQTKKALSLEGEALVEVTE